MKLFFTQSLTIIICILFLNTIAIAETPSFVIENSFNFVVKNNVVGKKKIQLYTNFENLEHAKKNEILKKIDRKNILTQYYDDLGDVLIGKEIFLIDVPLSEFEKNKYKTPDIQKILFPSISFHACNATSCSANQEVSGQDITYTAFYNYIKNETDNTIVIEQLGTDWSMVFNNTLSYSIVTKNSETTSLITSYQIFILKDGTYFFQNQVVDEVKKQITDFYNCFYSNRCKKPMENIFTFSP